MVVHGLLAHLDVDGFGCSSLPVAGHTAPLHSGTIPVNHVVRLMAMDCDAVLRGSTFHHLLVFTESYFERPLGLSNVGLMASFTGDLVDHSSLPLFRDWGQGGLQASEDPQTNPAAGQDLYPGGEEERSGLITLYVHSA